MSTASPLLGTPVDITITLASLASDAAQVAGRASTAVDQATVDGIDCLLGGLITLGTGPTAAKMLEIWLYGQINATPLYTGGATGSDANLTPSEKTLLMPFWMIPTVATTNKAYQFGPYSVAQAFGGIIPPKWGVYIVHNTGVALNATGGNHKITYTPVNFESA